jgi:hypothetical protein
MNVTSRLPSQKAPPSAISLVRKPDFSKLEARVQSSERKRVALEQMLSVLNDTQNFDEEDKRSVEELLMSVLQEEQKFVQELENRRRLYDDTLYVAQQQLQERHDAMRRLNDKSEAFTLFPELAEKFAKRQASMIQLVADATIQLEAV